jgi:3-hydroxybutyryl-CoA dehydrogenase
LRPKQRKIFQHLNIPTLKLMDTIGILGAGAMGSGIAQVAAAAGHNVVICDNLIIALTRASRNVQATLKTLVDKGKMTDADSYALFSRLKFTDHMSEFRDCSIVIEAIVEDIEQKQIAFRSMEAIVDKALSSPAIPPRLSISAMGARSSTRSASSACIFSIPPPLCGS